MNKAKIVFLILTMPFILIFSSCDSGGLLEETLSNGFGDIFNSVDSLFDLSDEDPYYPIYQTFPDALPSRNYYSVDFNGIPPALTVEEARENLEERMERVLEHFLDVPLTHYPTNDDERGIFWRPAIARVVYGIDGDKINDIILDPETKQWGLYGSTFDILPGCERYGDYDFTTQGILKLIYTDKMYHNIISEEALEKLRTKLLTKNGNEHYTHFSLGICGNHKDTENHILMTNSSIYLTNQLLLENTSMPEDLRNYYDNEKNGNNKSMLNYLKTFYTHGFEEYNSRPYQGFTVMALNNLHNYAEDDRVRLAAGMLLEYLGAVFAVQSNNLRRVSPFRRQQKYSTVSKAWDGESESARFALLSGNYWILRGDERPLYRQSKQYGGGGGKAFNDKGRLPDHPVANSIYIKTGKRVDRVVLNLYHDGSPDPNSVISLAHGGNGGKGKSLSLNKGEYITKMEVHTGTRKKTVRIFFVEFTTSEGRNLSGGSKTSNRYTITAPEGFQISGFMGRSGGGVDKLGAIFTPVEYLYEDNSYTSSLWGNYMIAAAVSEYRPSDAVLDLMIRKDHTPYFQKFRHQAVEFYSSSKSFLITGGGVFEPKFMFGSKEQHGWARPTTLMPTHDPSSDFKNWIRILGNDYRMRRYNHGIAPNFACGSNVIIPPTIPEECREKIGNWHFFDFGSEDTPWDFGFYAVVYRKGCDSNKCKDQGVNFGFFEAREADEISYDEFKSLVLEYNEDRNYTSGGYNTYKKSDGQVIRFEAVHDKKWTYGIASIDGEQQQRDMNKWGMAEGDIINGGRDGKLVIDNPYLGKRVILNMTDPLNPRRREIDF